MLELPEVLARTAELRKNLVGKTVDKVLPPSNSVGITGSRNPIMQR